MSYLWTQAELDAKQGVPFSYEEGMARFDLRLAESEKRRLEMVIKPSLRIMISSLKTGNRYAVNFANATPTAAIVAV